MDTPTRDGKVVAIWILALALIVVTILYVVELRKPDSLTTFTDELVGDRTELKEACADTQTPEGRDRCINALEETSKTVEELKQ